MNRPAAIPATLTTEVPESARAKRPIALWAFVAIAVVIACAVLAIDGSLTPSQRLSVFLQSGMFP